MPALGQIDYRLTQTQRMERKTCYERSVSHIDHSLSLHSQRTVFGLVFTNQISA